MKFMWLLMVIMCFPLHGMYLDLVKLPGASLALFEHCSYDDQSLFSRPFEFEVYQHNMGVDKKKEAATLNMCGLASRGNVRANMLLAASNLAIAEKNGSAVHRFSALRYLNSASKQGHPVAQEKLGRIYFLMPGNKKQVLDYKKKALVYMKRSACPRELPGVNRCYYHMPAIDFLLDWYSKNPDVRLSSDSLYYAQLAAELKGSLDGWQNFVLLCCDKIDQLLSRVPVDKHGQFDFTSLNGVSNEVECLRSFSKVCMEKIELLSYSADQELESSTVQEDEASFSDSSGSEFE